MSAVRIRSFWFLSFVLLISLSSAVLMETGCGSGTKTSSTGTSGGTNGGTNPGGGTGGTGTSAAAQEILYVAAGVDVSAWVIHPDASVTPVAGSPFAVGGQNVTADPAANFLFTLGGTSASDEAVNTDAIASDGSLKLASSVADSTLTSGISINPSGTALYVGSISAAQDNSGYKIYSIQSDGSLKFITGFTNQIAGNLSFTPDGTNAYSAYCYHLDAEIVHYSVAADGTLTPVNGHVDQIESMNECPNAVALNPAGSLLAAAWSDADAVGPIDNRIMLYNVDPATHALTAVSGGPFPASGAGVDAAIDVSGKFLVVAQDNGVGVYQIGQNSVTEVSGSPFAAGTNINRIMFSPSGGSLAAISNAGGQVYVFTFNSSTGALTAGPGSPLSLTGPHDLTIARR